MNSLLSLALSSLLVITLSVLAYWIYDTVQVPEQLQHPTYKFPDPASGMGSKTAYVLGGSGGVGKSIIKALADTPQFTRVTILGRRPIELPTDDPKYAKFVQKTIDFENISAHGQDFAGFDVGFCSLGAHSGQPNYYKITHDYVLDTAKLAKAGGTRHFHLVTAQWSDPGSRNEALRVKGILEQNIRELGFERTSIYQPLFIITEKDNPRITERIFKPLMSVLDHWRLASVQGDVLGRVMVRNTFRETAEIFEVINNAAINRLGKELK